MATKPTAVVVDDSVTARAILKSTLQAAGFEVVAEGERGDQAVTLFEQFRPTLITLDIVMPILDGVRAAEVILRLHPEAQIVMCSSLNSREKVLACRDLGVKHFILKPMVPEAVIKIVQRLAAGPGAGPTAEVPS